MSEMVERVARALCKERFLNGGIEDDDGWDSAPPALQEQYRKQARAAIEANPSVYWHSMIDAAFDEPPTKRSR